MTHILIIEDNKDLAVGLSTNLQLEGYGVSLCYDGNLALSIIENINPDLIILDMMLPNKDGFQIIKEMQLHQLKPCILCLTARGEEIDKVRALRLGADDYLTKPFGLMELLARVEALLRRSSTTIEPGNVYQFADVKIQVAAKQVTKSGQLINLTPKEFELLVFLIKHKNIVHSRLDIMKQVWGHLSEVNSRTVDTHIAELRKKLEPQEQVQKHIVTVPKSGYKLIV